MSSKSVLAILRQHRDTLLLAEVAALLHDVGKFCNLHVESHSAGGQQRWSNDHAYKAIADTPSNRIRLQQSVRRPDVLRNILNAGNPKASDFLPTTLKDFLAQTTINLINETYALDELIMLGTPGFATSPQRANLLVGKAGWLAAALGVCHSEAHVDKQEPARGEGQQDWPNVFISNAFGIEQETLIVDDSPNSLTAHLRNLQPDKKSILEAFSHGLGDTRRPINEVLLSDWGWMVASLFKSAVAGAIVFNQQAEIRQWKNWQERIIDHDLRWRLLRVNFDVLGLYAKAVKIADLLGYRRAVDEACERVKQLVEEEYPLGNEVYRDTTGIYFTFPDLDLPADLAQEIRRSVEEVEPELAPRIAVTVGEGQTAAEQLKGILAQARREALQALAQPFDMQNLSTCWQQQWETAGEGKWEVCPVCRLRPMWEAREACAHCETRRDSRITAWQQDPHRTIWMDELADANGRVALLVGKFGLDDWLSGDLVQTMLVKAEPNNPAGCTPKNPSPARLRRVWETCQRFWAETVQGILDSLPDRQRWLLEVVSQDTLPPDGLVCDGTLNGSPISVWRVRDALLTTSFMPEEPKPGTLSLSWEQDGRKGQATYQVRQVSKPDPDYLCYHPTLTLLASPDQFLALVPAADALVIADKIRDEYEKQFGKVLNRLPLFLGLVFFPRKMPLLAVMDAARRMLEAPLREESWTVECCRPEVEGHDQYLRLSQGEDRLTLKVPIKMGDNTTYDIWYPYMFVERFADGTPDSRQYRFQDKGRWLVHISNLKENDVIKVTPSRFAYLWLEHTAQRFVFDPQRDPLLLAELPRLIKMWNDIRASGITITGLRNVQALLEAKSAAWGIASDEFRHLVETTLQEACLFRRKDPDGNPLPDVVAPEDVISGRFFRCLELYLHILKQKI